jgi:uncharacterized protein YxjI
MALCIRERIFSWGDHYDVYDEDGNVRYIVQGEVFSFGHKIHLYDEHQVEIAFIQEKVWSFFKTFEIFIGGKSRGFIQKKFSWFVPRYQVDFMNLEIIGHIFEWNYEFRKDEETVGLMQRKILCWGNVYYLTAMNLADELSFLALSLAIDAARSEDEDAAIMCSIS